MLFREDVLLPQRRPRPPTRPRDPSPQYGDPSPRWRLCGVPVSPGCALAVTALVCVLLGAAFTTALVVSAVEALPDAPHAPPPPPSSPPTRAGYRFVADPNYLTNSRADNVLTLCGEGDVDRPTSLCVDLANVTTTAGVRCCTDDVEQAPRSSCCTSYSCNAPPCACAESGEGFVSCLQVSSAFEAEARCAALGLRLCSLPELLQLRAAGIGCLLDMSYVWSSTEC